MRLSIQEMIEDVLSETGDVTMSKIAAEANGEDKAKKPVSKEEAERQADKEEAQQGGGQPQSATPEKTASNRVQKLAAAVEEIVATITGRVPSSVGRVVTAAAGEAAGNVGPGKGPGATATNVDDPTPGEQSDISGEAKTKIPTSPPMESKGSGGNEKAPANAMATNADDMLPAQPADGVLKQGALANFASELLGIEKAAVIGAITGAVRGSKASKKGEKYEGAIRGAQAGAGGGGVGALGGGAAGTIGGGAAGSIIGGLAGLATRRPGLGAAIGGAAGSALGGIGGAVTGDILGGRAATKSLLKKRKEMEKEKEKKAEDAINPAQISAPKAKGLPEDQPSSMKRPAEVTSQEKHLASNAAPVAVKKVQTQAVPKKRMGEVLDEPAQVASTDKVLDQALGADKVDQAGAKIASDQKVKVAAARALLQKIASEGCTCGPDTEVCMCSFGKLASRLKKGGEKGSEKRSMFGADGVPPSVQASSPAGSQAGGATPQV